MNLASPATALSPAVKHLICCVGCGELDDRDEGGCRCRPLESETSHTETETHETCDKSAPGSDKPLVTPHCDLDLDRIASLFPECDNSANYFEKAVRVLAPVFAQCQSVLSKLSGELIESTLIPRLRWTCSEKIFRDCLILLGEDQEDDARDILVVLLVSAVLERALGNVYLVRGSQCPSMLKDLLVTEELKDILGHSVIQILRVVIGPPVSLNLRNVAWHGFLGDQELSRRYCCFLMLLAVGIGDILTGSGLVSIPQRPFFVWTPEVKNRLRSALQGSGDTESLPDLQDVEKRLRECSVIQTQTQQQWTLLFQLYIRGSYGYCLSLLLPLLEQCLRRLFATVNHCPERVLTAESAALYTTFNEMLEPSLPDGTTNQLPEFLTTPCMDLLHDLLFYPEGPRVRDHLSHGEVEFAAVDQDIVVSLLHVVIFLAHRLCPQPSLAEDTCVEEVERRVQSYRSVFHPVAILRHKYAELLLQLEETKSSILQSAFGELLGGQGLCGLLNEDNALWARTQETLTSLWRCEEWATACPLQRDHLMHGFRTNLNPLKQIAQQHIPTLFRWQSEGESGGVRGGGMKESECVKLLVRMTEESSTAVRQVHHMLQDRHEHLVARNLHSRQRKNLKRLLLCVPCLQVLLTTIAASIGWTILRLSDYCCLSKNQCDNLQKFLKVSLRQCENLRSYTVPNTNKWTESVELLIHWIPICQNFFQQWHEPSESVSEAS